MARRWPVVVGAVVGLFALSSGVAWRLWLPEWRPSLRAGERYGVDVSAHQGPVDWGRVAADGIGFAYIKASEGADFADAEFSSNWPGAAEAGLERGAYHFFTLCSPGAAQAANFLRVTPPDPAALAPAVDLELAGNCRDRPERAAVVAELDTFLAAVESAWGGRPVVVYLGADFERRYRVRSGLGSRPLWLRRFVLRPHGGGANPIAFWQVHGYARVAGIPGRADLNVDLHCECAKTNP